MMNVVGVRDEWAGTLPGGCENRRGARWGNISLTAAMLTLALPLFAATCPTVGKPMMGAEPQILIDATCEDPGFNERNFKIDKVTESTLTVKGTGQQIAYTQVDAHFDPTQTRTSLPAGVTNINTSKSNTF